MSRLGSTFLTIMIGAIGGLPAAADPPKEGNFAVSLAAYGTSKGAAVGKTRYQSILEYDGLMVGEGLLDHMTVHCMGMNGRTDQTRRAVVFCIFTDKDGDQIAEDVDESYPNGAKEIRGSAKLVAGTGKYEGISGELTFVNRGTGFRTAAENTFVVHAQLEGHYRLSK